MNATKQNCVISWMRMWYDDKAHKMSYSSTRQNWITAHSYLGHMRTLMIIENKISCSRAGGYEEGVIGLYWAYCGTRVHFSMLSCQMFINLTLSWSNCSYQDFFLHAILLLGADHTVRFFEKELFEAIKLHQFYSSYLILDCFVIISTTWWYKCFIADWTWEDVQHHIFDSTLWYEFLEVYWMDMHEWIAAH